MFRQRFADSYLFAVGSTVNGLGSFNSDMDLCLVVPDPYVGSGTDRRYALQVLNEARWLLVRNRWLVQGVQLIPAKVPILKMVSSAGLNYQVASSLCYRLLQGVSFNGYDYKLE